MSDITKCYGNNCIVKNICWRYLAPANEYYQAYSDFTYNKGCKHFWKHIHQPKKQL